MGDGIKKENKVPFDKFLQELQMEFDYHANGGTSYRKTAAMLGLEVARQIGDTAPFFDLETSRETVLALYPELDTERVEDVSKFLCTIAKDLYFKVSLSDDVKSYIQQKRKHRKPLSFVKKVKE